MSSAQPVHTSTVLSRVATSVCLAGSALVAASCASTSSDEVAAEPATEIVVVEEQVGDSASSQNNLSTDSGNSRPQRGPNDQRLVPEQEMYGAQRPQEATVAGQTKSITDPNSIWILVNKHNSLPRYYEPEDLVTPDMPAKGTHLQLRAEAAKALVDMSRAAQVEIGKPIQLVSGYRSYDNQKDLYDKYVAKDGQEAADTYSARPGFSEHQTGLTADLSTVHGKMEKFGDSKLGKWTAENSWKFGYVLRYTPQNHSTAGYQPESWHYRYVGKELAKYYHENHLNSLEEAFNLPAAPDYQTGAN